METDMNFDDLKNKATDAVQNSGKADDVLNNVSESAKNATDHKYDDKIDSARDAISSKIGHKDEAGAEDPQAEAK